MFTHDRLSRLLAGSTVLLGVILGCCVTPWGHVLTAVVGVNLVRFAITGRCQIKELMDRLEIPYEHPPEHLCLAPRRAPPPPCESTPAAADATSYRLQQVGMVAEAPAPGASLS